MTAGSRFDGVHGVVADSLSVSWQNVADSVGSNNPAQRFSGPRVTPDVGGLTTGRDWCLYELIDRTQVFADNTQRVRALAVESLELQFGRGRVFDAPYGPRMNAEQFPFRDLNTLFGDNMLARNRVTAFRGTVMTAGIKAKAVENNSGDPTLPWVYVLENYRAFISEGRPSVQRVADFAWCTSRAELDVPIGSTAVGKLITPVPDYATGLRVDNPKASYQTTTDLCVAWVDAFGNRFPSSAANYAQGQFVSDVTSQLLTVPWWASGMHLYNANPLAPGPALDFPIFITWELLV